MMSEFGITEPDMAKFGRDAAMSPVNDTSPDHGNYVNLSDIGSGAISGGVWWWGWWLWWGIILLCV